MDVKDNPTTTPVEAPNRYTAARESALRMMSEAIDRGGRHWTREELYEERLGRLGDQRVRATLREHDSEAQAGALTEHVQALVDKLG